MIVKTKRQLKIIESFGGNPNRRLQFVKRYSAKKHYIRKIKEELDTLWTLILALISTPFLIIFQLFQVLLSLRYWELTYIKKNLKDESLVVQSKPKELEIDGLYFDSFEECYGHKKSEMETINNIVEYKNEED